MNSTISSPLISHRRKVIRSGYDRASCWVHARSAAIPGGPLVVTLQRCLMGATADIWDSFTGISTILSHDGGRTWGEPVESPSLSRRAEGGGIEVAISDFSPQWHRQQGKLLGIGHTCRYLGDRLMPAPRPRESAYSVFDPSKETWSPVRFLEMPDRMRFFSAGAGSVQWVEKENGELLIPIYFYGLQDVRPDQTDLPRARVIVLRCRFDGEALTLLEIGEEIFLPVHRGLSEPSLVFYKDRYHLTLRSGHSAYYTHSADGLRFAPPQPWRFDTGEPLGSYDTQAHWAEAGGRLHLVYTRRAEHNDHVVRHRAPLFISEMAPEGGVLLRESEQIVVPNRGAMLGNFGVSQSHDGTALICASEWMENAGEWNTEVWNALKALYPQADLPALAALPGRCGLCELSGSDNSVHLVTVGP